MFIFKGTSDDAQNTANALSDLVDSKEIDLVIIAGIVTKSNLYWTIYVGDISYACCDSNNRDNQTIEDVFSGMIQDISGNVPVMTAHGNHESDEGTPYKKRFSSLTFLILPDGSCLIKLSLITGTLLIIETYISHVCLQKSIFHLEVHKEIFWSPT